jgi:NAD(P)-dependent dehydrogenase (short-subunit alcohol dehydrogenase family)
MRALITGGRAGIGAGIARALAGDGSDVVVGARTRDQIEAVADEIVGRSPTPGRSSMRSPRPTHPLSRTSHRRSLVIRLLDLGDAHADTQPSAGWHSAD